MADKKITELPAVTAVQPAMLLAVVDDPSGTPTNKKATAAQLIALAPDLTYLGSYVSGTYNEGDIVIASDGIAYLCVKDGTTTAPVAWPGSADGGGVGGPHHTTHEPGGSDQITLLALGTNPATTGLLRLANNGSIVARKADNSADMAILTLNASNAVELGKGATSAVRVGEGGLSLSGQQSGGGSGSIYVLSNPTYGNVLLVSWFGSSAQLLTDANRLLLQSANLIVIGPQGGAVASQWWFDNVAFYPAGVTDTQDIGTTAARVRSIYAATIKASAIKLAGDIQFESAAGLGNRTYISCLADGNLTLFDHNGSTFDRLQFGGTSASFPAFKRNGTALNVRLADDSADASLTAATATAGTNTTQVATTAFVQTAAASRPFRLGYTWSVVGAVTAVTLNSIFLPMNGTQAAVLVSIRTKLASGTSIVVQVKRNGTNVGSTITVTTTATTTSLGSVTLAADDELTLVTSTPTGSPVTLTATIVVEHTP